MVDIHDETPSEAARDAADEIEVMRVARNVRRLYEGKKCGDYG